MEMIKKLWRPPPIDRKFHLTLHWLNWYGCGRIGEIVERALVSYSLCQLDELIARNHDSNNNFDMKEAEMLTQWLKEKENELYGASLK